MKNNQIHKKEIILQAGIEAMFQKGYHGTGIKEIVDKAGIPKGSFYHYFESKEDFVISALDHLGQMTLERFKENLYDNTHEPRERILRFFDDMIRVYTKELDYTRGCFIGNMSQELADTHPEVKKKVDSIFRSYDKVLANCIEEAQKKDQMINRDRPGKLAEFILNSWEGTLLRMKASRNIEPLNAFRDILKYIILK